MILQPHLHNNPSQLISQQSLTFCLTNANIDINIEKYVDNGSSCLPVGSLSYQPVFVSYRGLVLIHTKEPLVLLLCGGVVVFAGSFSGNSSIPGDSHLILASMPTGFQTELNPRVRSSPNLLLPLPNTHRYPWWYFRNDLSTADRSARDAL